jgi:hypothetical protein
MAESPGPTHDLPRSPVLSFVGYDNFGRKIATSGKKQLLEYHEITKYRIHIAEYCLRLLLDNYDNDIAFVAGLTGFLVQAKGALDSVCQEINLNFELSIGPRPDYVTNAEELTEPSNLLLLSKKNVELGRFVVQELGASNSWFASFKILRDSEGVQRQHSQRLIPLGIAAHDIEVGDTKIAEFCVDSLTRINTIAETCYRLMT